MQGYIKALRRFKPSISLQTMIDVCKRYPLRKDLQAKKKQVLRDWFQLVLWYVGLRRASKSQYCSKLLEVYMKV